MRTTLLIAFSAVAMLEAQRPAMGDPPGWLIEIEGRRQHIHCTGAGSPTVVIDGGAGAWSVFYLHIQREVSGARVCTYDRAGLGWSDPRPGPRTSERMAEELHALLHAAGVQPPLVLAGHSLGGYNVRVYQARYPEEVGALVLLDAAHEEQWDRLPPRARDLAQMSAAGLQKRADQARQGMLQPKDITPPDVLVKHLPELREAYVAAMLTPTPHRTLAAETEDSLESARQLPAGRHLGDLPLVVLTARNSFDAFKGTGIPIEEANAVWQILQQELAALSNKSQHLFSDGHHRLKESDPDAVVRAIELAIAAVQRRTSEQPAKFRLQRLPPVDDRAADVQQAGRRAAPPRLRVVEQVGVPQRTVVQPRSRSHLRPDRVRPRRVPPPQRLRLVPPVQHASIVQQIGRPFGSVIRGEHVEPDCVHAQVRVWRGVSHRDA